MYPVVSSTCPCTMYKSLVLVQVHQYCARTLTSDTSAKLKRLCSVCQLPMMLKVVLILRRVLSSCSVPVYAIVLKALRPYLLIKRILRRKTKFPTMVSLFLLNKDTDWSMIDMEKLSDAETVIADDSDSFASTSTDMADIDGHDDSSYKQAIEDSDTVLDLVKTKSSYVVPATKSNIPKTHKKKVLFSTVSIREFAIDIGDNPTPRSGPSITIQWRHHSSHTISVDEYEQSIPGKRKGRQMLIPAPVRLEMLVRAGYSHSQIIRETKPVNIARTQRQRTIATLGLSELHEVSEKISRSTKNILSLGLLKRKENDYLTASGVSKSAPSA